MKKSIESKIRINVALIYFLVALVCGGFFFYFYSPVRNIDTKKNTMEEYNKELTETNELIDAINKAQTEANLYVATKQLRHLRSFRKQTENIEFRIDSLRTNRTEFPGDSILGEIHILLKEKGKAITALNRQFSNPAPLDSLTEKLQVYIPKERIETYIDTSIVTTFADTLIQEQEKGNFLQRLSNVFTPQKKEDTVVTVKQMTTNIVKVIETDSLPLPVNQMVEEAQLKYFQHITAIEKQVSSLILADQDISSKISNLLIQLYSQIINSRLEEIDAEQVQLRQKNIVVLIGGGIALSLILLFIILIIQDVNKGYAARKALEEANQRTRELMESRHKLLLSVSHDVKTPLNSILGYLELSQQKKELSPKEIVSMKNSGKHILTLLNNLLEFSSLEQGTLLLADKDFSLEELCDEVYDMFAPLAQSKALQFNYIKDFPSGQMVYSDPVRVKQILTNILSNAVKYTPKGSISFKSIYRAGSLQFCVTDTGVGVSAEKVENVFKPFTRIDDNNSLAEGSGFGMYVVKGLVDLFGGKIVFNTKQGEGTQVIISLKVSEGKQKISDISLKKIVIIDDDEPCLTMMRQLSEQLGHTVTTCHTKEEFERILPTLSNYNQVLTDMEMGVFSGKDVLRKIQEKNIQIPVILVSGRMDYNINIARSDGFDNYLEKPVTLQNLRMVIGGETKENVNVDNFFDGERDEVIEVIEQFLYSNINNIVLLREAVKESNPGKAQSICHKMQPMFSQIGAGDTILQILKEMDGFHSGNLPEAYPWKDKISQLTELAEEFLSQIQENYFSD